MHVDLFTASIYAGKTTVVLLFLVFLYRILGKRELAQMNVYDLVTIVAVSNAVQNGMTQGRGELWVGLVCSSSLVLVAFFIMRLFVKFPTGERILFGHAVLLLSDGVPIVEAMRRQRVSEEDLNAALRSHGLTEPQEAAMAVLELDGSISVVPKGHAKHIDSDLSLG